MAIEFLSGINLAGDLELKKTDPKIILFDDSGANGTPNGEIVFSEVDGYENFNLRYNGLNDRFEYWGLISNTSTLVGYWNRSTDTSLHSVGTISTGSDGDSTDWKTAYDHSQATHAPTDAEANVQADWTATSGDALILNKPTTFAPSAHNHDDRYYTETETNLHRSKFIGWEPAYGSSSPYNVKWNVTENAIQIQSDTDTSTGAAYKAQRVIAGEVITITLMAKASTAAGAGLYVRLYQYNGDLPDGKTHVSNNADSSTAVVQEDSSSITSWVENVAVTTDWVTYEKEVAITTDGYVSVVVLNWTGIGTNTLYITTPDIQTTKAADSDLLDGQEGTHYLDYDNFSNTPTLPTSYAPTDAEANVQADWDETTDTSDSFILNKPTIPTDFVSAANGGTFSGTVTINKDGDALNLRSVTNGQPTNLTFSTNVPHSQIGHIKYSHSNSASYGGGDSFTIGGTETTTVILADGQLMYKDGIYSKPATGTGAGTRKDSNWDTAYTHSQATHAPTDAEANVQADWTETTTTSDAFILNKPTIPSGNSIIDWTADQGSTNIHVNNVVGYINSTEPNEPFNPFAGQKFHDGVLTNALAGRHDRFVVTIDGTVETGASLKLSNQNFEEYNQNRLFGTSAGETKVFNINVQSLASGSPNSSGITYSAGFFDINFYSTPFPASWSARVKNKNGAWNPVTSLTKIGNSKLRGVIPINNYLTDIEFTLTARTSSPFVTGNITYGISEFELFFSRMASSQGGNISSIGGYLGGVITTASGTTSTNWNSAYGWGDHSLAGYSTATGVANNAEVNVQADWNETSNTSDAFILNKPTVSPPSELYRQTGGNDSANIGPGWITVAKNQSNRRHGEVIVSDEDSGDHAFIRIDWMRSYSDSNFSVLNVGGHQNRITGVRVLSQDSDPTYGWKYLQVYVTVASVYGVRVHTIGTPKGYTSHTAIAPILENTKSGYTVTGNALTDLNNSSLAAEEGLTVGGDIAVGGTVDGVDIAALPTSFAPTDAEANVQADWNETTTTSDAFILNKPTIPTVPSSYAPTDAEANVQADWDETTTTSDAFILNKPTIPTSFNNLNAVDDRDIAPEDLTYNDDFRIYFADKGQIEGGSNTSDYQDLLVLNSYTDATGGDANALAFDKSAFRILHYQADQADTNWGTAKQIAYTDEIPTDHGDHDGLYVPVGGGTITSGTSVGLTINHNTFEQGLVLHRNHASNAASIVFKNNGGVNGTFFAAAADGAPYWQYNDTASPNYRIHTTNDFTVATVTGALPKAGGTMTGTLVMSAVNPEIHFNGTSDTGVDMAIKATPEGLDFYEPEDTNKIHFQILDDSGVNAVYGYKVNGTDVISSTKVLANVTGNISMFTNDSGYLTRTTPVAPSSLTTTIVNSTINVGFTASTTTNIDYYLVFSSVSGGDYGLISVIPPADFGATMSIIDNTFDATGTQAYRVYAVKNGVYSAALTGSEDYAVTSAEPTNMSVVNLNTAYYVQWDPPSANARFITAYNVYKHEHAAQGSLDRNSATLIYSGLNTSYMYQISGSNNINYHQFWVETTIG